MALPDFSVGDRYDADRLLAGYRTARAQEALFDLRDGPGGGYDEFVDSEGDVRATWNELADTISQGGRAGLDRMRSVVHSLIDHDGITYTGMRYPLHDATLRLGSTRGISNEVSTVPATVTITTGRLLLIQILAQ